MPTYAYTKAVEDELKDLHNGLHHAMENLINRKDYEEAEKTLRIIDDRMSSLINQARIARLT
ncbi:MAG: hypothetical protein ABTQ31_16965 [Rhizobiaceae bacterium]